MFGSPTEARHFARLVAQEMLSLQQAPLPKHVTFAEAREKLGIKDDALTRRIQERNIPTYRIGRGKAFDRNYLPLLY